MLKLFWMDSISCHGSTRKQDNR